MREPIMFARHLRRRQTSAEKLLWSVLRNRQCMNLKFRRQVPMGIFILDFYCYALQLCIEVDGDIHLFQTKYDKYREECLQEMGIRVIRFSNDMVLTQLDIVLERIKAEGVNC